MAVKLMFTLEQGGNSPDSGVILIAVSLLLTVPSLKINVDAIMRLNGRDNSNCTSWFCRNVLNFDLEQ